MCEQHIQYTLLVYTAIIKAALQAVERVRRNVVWKIAQELEFRDMGTGEQTTGTLLIQITYQTCTSRDESSSIVLAGKNDAQILPLLSSCRELQSYGHNQKRKSAKILPYFQNLLYW